MISQAGDDPFDPTVNYFTLSINSNFGLILSCLSFQSLGFCLFFSYKSNTLSFFFCYNAGFHSIPVTSYTSQFSGMFLNEDFTGLSQVVLSSPEREGKSSLYLLLSYSQKQSLPLPSELLLVWDYTFSWWLMFFPKTFNLPNDKEDTLL